MQYVTEDDSASPATKRSFRFGKPGSKSPRSRASRDATARWRSCGRTSSWTSCRVPAPGGGTAGVHQRVKRVRRLSGSSTGGAGCWAGPVGDPEEWRAMADRRDFGPSVCRPWTRGNDSQSVRGGFAKWLSRLFLKITGIPGESNDSKHKGEIEIESFTWGEHQTATASHGAAWAAAACRCRTSIS